MHRYRGRNGVPVAWHHIAKGYCHERCASKAQQVDTKGARNIGT